MYIEQEELQSRLKGQEEQRVKIIKAPPRVGRGVERTHQERALAGALSRIDSGKNVEALTGIKAPNQTNYSKGIISHQTGLDEKLRDDVKTKVTTKLDKARSDAIDVIADTLGSLSTRVKDGASSIKAKDLSSIAKDMAVLHEKLGPKEPGADNRVQIVIHAPEQKSIDKYQVVEV